MLNAIVQFLRNALCCIKDLHLFPESIIHHEHGAHQYLFKGLNLTLPEPLDKTSLLEFVISWTQLYATVSTTLAGLHLIWNSVGKLRRLVRLLESRLHSATEGNNNNNDNKSKRTTPLEIAANRVVNESLLQQAKAAMRGVFVGILVTPIGVAFFWLFANSWHVTETPWIGGWLGLIDALTVMEICLVPLLLFMIVDALDYFGKAKDTKRCIASVESQEMMSSPANMTLTTYEFMNNDWVPFWEGGVSPLSKPMSTNEETKLIDMEVAAVQRILTQWYASEEEKKGDNEKEQKMRQEALAKSVSIMKSSLFELYIKGYRELLYFVLNFIAFYGYLMGIVTFYFPDDTAQPGYVQTMKFGYGNAIADWTGNFAGDLMWTVEPIVILTSPLYLTYMKQLPSTKSGAKEKSKTE